MVYSDKEILDSFEQYKDELLSFFNRISKEYGFNKKQTEILFDSVKHLVYFLKMDKTERIEAEIQFKEEFGHASNTYLSARDRLIKNGLIKQTYRGGMCRGDMATYKILITPDLRESELRWLRYPKQNWAKEIPKNKNTLVGVKTRFKSKPTLINSTLNGEIHP